MSRRAQAGFTLIELMMGIVLSSIFALALFGFFFSGVSSARTSESQARAQSDGRTAIDRLVREARQAISPDDGLTAPIFGFGPTVLEMYVDPSRVNADKVPRPQKVRYEIVANQLIRQSANPIGPAWPFSYPGYGASEILIEKLSNGAIAAFAGTTADGVVLPPTPSPTQYRDIAQISIRLLVSQTTGNAATTLELKTDVALRNAIRL